MENNRLLISKRSLTETLVFLFFASLAVLSVHFTSSTAIHVVTFWLLGAVAIALSRLDLFHPFLWFTVIFLLYSTAYALVHIIGGRFFSYDKNQIMLPLIAYITAMIIIRQSTYRPGSSGTLLFEKEDESTYEFLDLVIIILISLTFLASAYLLLSGYSGKQAMKSSNDIIYRFGVYFVRFITFFVIVRVCTRIKQNKKYMWCLLWGGSACLAFTFSTGERDAFIRFFLIVLFLLFYLGKISKKHFILLIPVSVLTLILSVELKYFFLTGTLNGSFSAERWFEQFLSSDFTAAGRNLQYLLDRPETKGYFGYKMLLTEILYPILPSSWRINPDYWFNYDLHYGGSHGYAFTLVGTGYIIGGTLGVVLVFAITAIVVRFLYSRFHRSIFWFAAYLYTITIVMICFRGSLHSIFNNILKEVVVSVLFCIIADNLLKGIHREKHPVLK